MSGAISMTLVSNPQSPLGRNGINVHVNCTINVRAVVNTPAIVRILDPAGRVLATETSNFSSVYTIRALISSFKDNYAGNYSCTVTLMTPALLSITNTETIHIYVGKMFNMYSNIVMACAAITLLHQ